MGSFVIFARHNATARLALLLLSLVVLIFAFLPQTSEKRRVLILLVSLASLLGMLFSHVYFGLWFNPESRFKEEVQISGVVCDMDESKYGGSIVIKTAKIDDKPLSRYKIRLTLEKKDFNNIDFGDSLTFTGRIDNVESEYLISDGISGEVATPENLYISEKRDAKPLAERIKNIREDISDTVISLTGKESGALIAALLLGERSYLPDTVQLDFRRSGISHILALSGMHLVILTFAISELLRLFRVGKKPRTAISALFAIVYVVFTGFPVTVVRAGIMLLIYSLLHVFSKSHDSPTSLAITVSLILFVMPYAAFDVALWLSAFATLGVIMAAEFLSSRPRKKSIPTRVFYYIAASIITSIFAISATLFISVFNFGTLSLVSPIATLIVSPLIEIIMYLGTLVIIFQSATPLIEALKAVSRFTLNIVEHFSDIDGVYVVAKTCAIYAAIIILTLALYAFFVLKIKHQRTAVCALALIFLGVLFTSHVSYKRAVESDELIYVSVSSEKDDHFFIRSNGITAVINESGYNEYTGYVTSSIVSGEGNTEIDKYYFTHYAYGIKDDVEAVLSNIKIHSIYLPKPRNEDERTILEFIRRSIRDYDIDLVLYTPMDIECIGEISYQLPYSEPYGKTSINSFIIKYNGARCLYLSSGVLDCSWKGYAFDQFPLSDVVIFGSHGKSYTSKHYFDYYYDNVDTIILSGDNLYFLPYFHQKYKENGCEILSHPSRVDLLNQN